MRYPDHIVVTWTSEPIKDEDSGIYTPGGEQTFESDCRIRANSALKKIEGEDSSLIDYAYDVYLPLPDTVVNIPAFKAEYVLTGDSVGEINGKVKKHINYQHNSHIWL